MPRGYAPSGSAATCGGSLLSQAMGQNSRASHPRHARRDAPTGEIEWSRRYAAISAPRRACFDAATLDTGSLLGPPPGPESLP